jgi:DNA repair protein RecN (Recombination protein N)
MLKQLNIHNIILIHSTEILFGAGFNVLSGETGSGKSAILAALGLICGDKSDTTIIRCGADKGSVEALFDIDALPELPFILSEAGIEHSPGEDLIICREITFAGKTRSFINNQPAQVNFLRKISHLLIGRVNQHAHHKLFSTEHHRNILDLYGDLHHLTASFSHSWDKENQIKEEIETLIQHEQWRINEIKRLQGDLEELREAKLKEGEEEGLFAEYTLLANAEELTQKTQLIVQALEGEKTGVLNILHKHQNSFDLLKRIDPKITDAADSFHSICLELKEISYTLQNYLNAIEYNPTRLQHVNERLSLINKLKRQYGPSIENVLVRKTEMEKKLYQLENANEHIADLKMELESVSKANNSLCAEISRLRKQTAKELSNNIVLQLRSLNMPKAEFQVEVVQQKRSRTGDDGVEFYMAPNIGERMISVKDCASGGEISRLLLSIQTLIAGKEQLPTLIFDEIDSNIGGATAAEVGKKLKDIGSKHQIICITHFSQVAKQANHHYQISKQEIQGRTLTQIVRLDEQTKVQELSRMQGELSLFLV